MTVRLHSLDGLRALAASLVVAHHLGVVSYANGLHATGHDFLAALIPSITASGVELFFVLSAIVLTRPYVLGERRMRLAAYFARRIERLWPPFLVVWLFAGLTLILVKAFPTWQTAGNQMPAFSIIDWLSQIGIVYTGDRTYNLAWWSLGVEVTFYVLVPVLVVAFSGLHRRQRVLEFTFVAVVALAVATSAFGEPAGNRLGASLLAYSSCFCAGLFLAGRTPSRRASFALIACGVAWILTASARPALNVHVGWGLFYFGVVALAMDPASQWARWLSGHWLVWLGERSYSLFLVHYSVITLAYWALSSLMARGPVYLIASRATAIVLTLIATIALFTLVERRFARGLVTVNELLPLKAWRVGGAVSDRAPV